MIKAIKAHFWLLVLLTQSGLAFGSQELGSLKIEIEGGVYGDGSVYDFGTQLLVPELPSPNAEIIVKLINTGRTAVSGTVAGIDPDQSWYAGSRGGRCQRLNQWCISNTNYSIKPGKFVTRTFGYERAIVGGAEIALSFSGDAQGLKTVTFNREVALREGSTILSKCPSGDCGSTIVSPTNSGTGGDGVLGGEERGTTNPYSYGMGSIDNINTLNGNLVASIPIGRSYSVGPTLSYQVTLTYNAKAWDSVPIDVGGLSYAMAVPHATTNAGLGWQVTMGELYPNRATIDDPATPNGVFSTWPNTSYNPYHAWLYIAPDGSRHFLYEDVDDESLYHHTKNGTNIRMMKDPSSPSFRYIYFPDGTRHTFLRIESPSLKLSNDCGASECWILIKMEDRTGNWVDISYGEFHWSITDSDGRLHEVKFFENGEEAGGEPHDPDSLEWGDLFQLVRHVIFNRWQPEEEYNWLVYDHEQIVRGCPTTQGSTAAINDQIMGLSVPILKSLKGPEHATAGIYEFVHNINNGSNITGSTQCDKTAGTLSEVKFPTGRQIEYTYDDIYKMPTNCSTSATQGFPYSRHTGVTSRIVKAKNGSTVGYSDFSSVLEERKSPAHDAGPSCNRHNIVKTSVMNRAHDDGKAIMSVFYHNVTRYDQEVPATGNWRNEYHGLPVTKNESLARTDGLGNLYLSTETWECPDENPSNCGRDETTINGGTLLTQNFQSNIVKRNSFWDGWACAGENGQLFGPLSRNGERCVSDYSKIKHSVAITYGDSGETSTSRHFSGYKDIGVFETGTNSSYINDPTNGQSSDVQVGYVYGEYVTGISMHGSDAGIFTQERNYETFPTSGPEILDLISFRYTSYGDGTGNGAFIWPEVYPTLTEYDFNPGTGFLNCVRIRKTPNTPTGFPWGDRNSRDLVREYTPNPAGFVAEVEFYGGDALGSGVSTSSVCTSTNNAEYKLGYSYAHSVNDKAWYIDASGNQSGAYLKNLSINLHTQRATQSCDFNGKCIDFDYDLMGRLTKVSDEHIEQETTYHLEPAGGRREVTVKRDINGELSVSENYLNEFGRPTKSRAKLNDTEWLQQRISYDTRGRLSTISAQQGEVNFDPTLSADILSYDTLGRVLTEVDPDGNEKNYSYNGARSDLMTLNQQNVSGQDVEIIHAQTPLGMKVTSSLKDNEVSVRGDEDNLVVETKRNNGTPLSQSRYQYIDPRGLLFKETIPELGDISYTRDSRGNITSMNSGGRFLTFHRNRSGQLISVKQGTQLWKTFDYDPDTGELLQSVRYNYLDLENSFSFFDVAQTIKVTTNFTYNTNGSLESKELEISANGTVIHESINSLFYDNEGKVNRVVYPQCVSGDCTSISYPSRHVRLGYDYGILTSVTDGDAAGGQDLFAPEYDPDGKLERIRFYVNASLVGEDELTYDAIGRFESITVKDNDGPTTLWQSGDFSYDAVGNILSTVGGTDGTKSYTYDKASRLKTFSKPGFNESYTYDEFDNITGSTGTGLATNYTLNTTNNRIDDFFGSPVSYDSHGNLSNWTNLYFSYDVFNRQVAASNHTDPANPEFSYLGQSITIYDVNDSAVGMIDRSQTRDGLVIYHRGPAGDTLREFRYVQNIQDPGSRTASYKDYFYFAGLRAIENGSSSTNGQKTFLRLDHLGSPRLLTQGPSGWIAERERYPHGATLESSGEYNETVDFTGHHLVRVQPDDDGDGTFHDMKARHYYSSWGRFVQPDPARDPSSWSLYGYAANNPISYVDPTGLAADGFTLSWASLISFGRNANYQGFINLFNPYSDVLPQVIGILKGIFGGGRSPFPLGPIEPGFVGGTDLGDRSSPPAGPGSDDATPGPTPGPTDPEVPGITLRRIGQNSLNGWTAFGDGVSCAASLGAQCGQFADIREIGHPGQAISEGIGNVYGGGAIVGMVMNMATAARGVYGAINSGLATLRGSRLGQNGFEILDVFSRTGNTVSSMTRTTGAGARAQFRLYGNRQIVNVTGLHGNHNSAQVSRNLRAVREDRGAWTQAGILHVDLSYLGSAAGRALPGIQQQAGSNQIIIYNWCWSCNFVP